MTSGVSTVPNTSIEPSAQDERDPDSPAGGGTFGRWPGWASAGLVVLLVAVLAGAVVGAHVRSYRTLSPIDEFQHVDYLHKISQGQLVRRGDLAGQAAARDFACRGLDYPGQVLPPCGVSVRYRPDSLPERGYNTAYIHPPTYYFLTASVARGLMALQITGDRVQGGRWAGVAWLTAGVLVFWRMGLQLGLHKRALAVAGILISTTPAVLHASATITPDAASLLAGAIVLLATLVAEKRKRYVFLLLGAGGLAVALKLSNITAVAACSVYLLLRWRFSFSSLREAWRRDRRRPAAAGLLIAGSAVAMVIWVFVQATASPSGPTNPQIERFHASSLTLDQLAGQLTALITPVEGAYTSFFLNNGVTIALVGVLDLLIILACFGPFFRVSQWTRVQTIAAATGITMLVGGVAFVLGNYFLNANIFVGIPPRYALSLLPLAGLAIAELFEHRSRQWIGTSLALVALGGIAYGLVIRG